MRLRASDIRFTFLVMFVAVLCAVAMMPGRADANTGSLKLRKFGPSGSVLLSRNWTGLRPRGIAINKAGHVFIAATDNKIRKYTNTGFYLSYIGLSGLHDIDTDAASNIWAIAQSGVYEFNLNGKLIRHWAASGDYIKVDQQGYVWFSDGLFIYRCKTDGTRIWTGAVRPVHIPGAEWEGVVGLTNTSSKLWAAYYGTARNQMLSYNRTAPTEAGSGSWGTTKSLPTSLANDSLGYLYFTARDNRIYKYNQGGTPIRNFAAGIQTQYDQTNYTRYAGIRVDATQNIWVIGQ